MSRELDDDDRRHHHHSSSSSSMGEGKGKVKGLGLGLKGLGGRGREEDDDGGGFDGSGGEEEEEGYRYRDKGQGGGRGKGKGKGRGGSGSGEGDDWVSKVEYDRLTSLCDRLMVQQDELQQEIAHQADVLQVDTPIASQLTIFLLFTICLLRRILTIYAIYVKWQGSYSQALDYPILSSLPSYVSVMFTFPLFQGIQRGGKGQGKGIGLGAKATAGGASSLARSKSAFQQRGGAGMGAGVGLGVGGLGRRPISTDLRQVVHSHHHHSHTHSFIPFETAYTYTLLNAPSCTQLTPYLLTP